jgi:hypothetical protein
MPRSGKAGQKDPKARADVAAMGLLAVPPAILLYLIWLDGVNVPYTDDWHLASLLQALALGKLTFGALWAQHLENRMFFSNLAMIAIARATHFDTKFAMYASWAVLTVAGAITAIVWRRTTALGWVWLLPPAVLIFSLLQYHPILHGFDLSIYLVLLCLAGICWLLTTAGGWGRLALAIGVGLLGTYCAVQGLALWPAGLVLLVVSGQSPRRVGVWCGAGVIAAFVYLFDFTTIGTGADFGWMVGHPVKALRFLLELTGAPVPLTSKLGIGASELQVLGGLLLLVALALVAIGVAHRSEHTNLALPLTLISFALAVNLLATLGRSQFGPGYALEPRYDIFSLWLLAGVWLALAALRSTDPHRLGALALGLTATLVALQMALSLHSGLSSGHELRLERERAVNLVANFRGAPAAEVQVYVYGDVPAFRALARFLQQDHLSVFATPGPKIAAGEQHP